MSYTDAKMQAEPHAAAMAAVEHASLPGPDARHLTQAEKAEAARAMIVARASRDPTFKAQLLADAPAALRGVGLGLRKGVSLKVVEDSESLIHLVLPAPPSASRISSRLRERLNPGC